MYFGGGSKTLWSELRIQNWRCWRFPTSLLEHLCFQRRKDVKEQYIEVIEIKKTEKDRVMVKGVINIS